MTSSFNETVWLSNNVALAMMEAVSASVQVPVRLITWGYFGDLCLAPTPSPIAAPMSSHRVLNIIDLALSPVKFGLDAANPRTFFSISGEPGGLKTMQCSNILYIPYRIGSLASLRKLP